jgi:hypothetical protein
VKCRARSFTALFTSLFTQNFTIFFTAFASFNAQRCKSFHATSPTAFNDRADNLSTVSFTVW